MAGRGSAFAWRVIAGVVLLNLLVAAGVFWSLYASFGQALSHASVMAQNLSLVLSENVSVLLDRTDLALLDAKECLESGRRPAPGVVFADARGHASDGTDVSNRPFFVRLRSARGLFVSGGPEGIVLARRINRADGRFSGAVFSVVSSSRLAARLSQVDVGPHGSVELADSAKALSVRAGRTGVSPSAVVSSRGLSRYPFRIAVSLSGEDSLAGWKAGTQQMTLLVAIIGLVSAGGAATILRAWRGQEEANERLASEEEKFHTMADHAQDWEYWQGPQGEIRYMSPSCERMTGYAAAEFEADPGLAARIVHPEDDGRDEEFRIVRRDGAIRWIGHAARQIFGADGKPLGWRITNRDITDRRLFEAEINRLAQAVEQSPTGILITDADGGVLFTNQAYTLITGLSFAAAYGKSQRELISDRIGDGQYAEIAAALSAGKPWSGALPDRSRNGEPRWVQFTASPIYDREGRVSNYLHLKTDISEIKRSEEALKRYNERLEAEVESRTADLILARNAAEAANRAKSNFLANMSHELRTPLNAILGFSSLMRKDSGLSEHHLRSLDIINRSGRHLLGLINDVLEMAKIEAGKLRMERAPFDLGAAIRDVVDMMTIRAGEKGLRLILDQASDFPRYVVGDEARLRQVLINLIGNAVKFTEQGGVTLRLGRRGDSRLLIEVEDSGPGISAEDQAKLFQPFVQLDSRQSAQGTGLGLAISRQFVELMGGGISLESVPGQGSIFRVDLPLPAADPSGIPVANGAVRGEVCGAVPGQARFRILIAEDQAENQILLSKLMENIGMETRIAGNGREAVELFRSWHPHLVWMDGRMPEMDGMEAARIIRTLPGGKDVKIVAVSASAFAEQRARMLESGMDGFVRKPYRFSEIYDCLASMLDVRYVYEDSGFEVDKGALDRLSDLPEASRRELKAALESLESVRVKSLIMEIEDCELRRALSGLAENFDYPAILKALEASGKA